MEDGLQIFSLLASALEVLEEGGAWVMFEFEGAFDERGGQARLILIRIDICPLLGLKGVADLLLELLLKHVLEIFLV